MTPPAVCTNFATINLPSEENPLSRRYLQCLLRWLNIDDQCGLLFHGSGQAQYRNRHTFPVWQAVADELILSLQDRPQRYQAGEEIAALLALWCPEQAHWETAQQALRIHTNSPAVVVPDTRCRSTGV